MFASTLTRFLLGCLIIGAYSCTCTPVGISISDSSPVSEQWNCTRESIRHWLNDQSSNLNRSNLNDATLRSIYEHCTRQFLASNKISPLVKSTVDQWIGLDLSQQTDPNELFLAYQLAILGPKPAITHWDGRDKFTEDCNQMFATFESYRDAIEPLTYYYANDADATTAMLELEAPAQSGAPPADHERGLAANQEAELLRFVQYTQLCKSLLVQTADGDEDPDANDDDDADELADLD